MREVDRLLTPAAILLSGCLISSAIYLRPVDGCCPPEAAPANSTSEDSRAAARVEPLAPLAPGAATSPFDRTEFEKQVDQALRARLPVLQQQCWEPALAKNPGLQPSDYAFTLTFTKEGRQMAWVVAKPGERRGETDEVTPCLRRQPMTMSIPPPGKVATTQVLLRFPQ